MDLVGSTAFKYKSLKASEADIAEPPGPQWITALKKFYDKFSDEFQLACDELPRLPEGATALQPRLWKTLGDEMIYAVEVGSVVEVSAYATAFIVAIQRTRLAIRPFDGLDLKGAAWLASFPAVDIEINLTELGKQHHASLVDDELNPSRSQEKNAPHLDFVGQSIDAGFRLAKFATSRKMALSVELALVLARAAARQECRFAGIFGYSGREELKGVLSGVPYPAIWLDIETDDARRAVIDREDVILPIIKPLPHQIADFCQALVAATPPLEMPYFEGDPEFGELPRSYREYSARQAARLEEETRKQREEVSASDAQAENEQGEELPPDIADFLSKPVQGGPGSE